MVVAVEQLNESSAEARRATLEQFAQLPAALQTAFIQRTYEQPELRTNPGLLQEAMQAEVVNHIQGQHKLELAALLQLSPQLAPTGREQELEQRKALEGIATTQVEVQQALQRGESVEKIRADVGNDNAVQVIVATEVQKKVETDQQQQVAENDAAHRKHVGLEQPEAAVNPFAAALAGNMDAAYALKAALSGTSQDHHAQVAVATVVNAAPDQAVGRT